MLLLIPERIYYLSYQKKRSIGKNFKWSFNE